jgi:hypothetical protein
VPHTLHLGIVRVAECADAIRICGRLLFGALQWENPIRGWLYHLLHPSQQDKQVLLVHGAVKSGKTTILKTILPELLLQLQGEEKIGKEEAGGGGAEASEAGGEEAEGEAGGEEPEAADAGEAEGNADEVAGDEEAKDQGVVEDPAFRTPFGFAYVDLFPLRGLATARAPVGPS